MKNISKNTWMLIVVCVMLFVHAGLIGYMGVTQKDFHLNTRGAIFALSFGGILVDAVIVACLLPLSMIYSYVIKTTKPLVGCSYSFIMFLPAFYVNMFIVIMINTIHENVVLLVLAPLLLPSAMSYFIVKRFKNELSNKAL